MHRATKAHTEFASLKPRPYTGLFLVREGARIHSHRHIRLPYERHFHPWCVFVIDTDAKILKTF
ncbi:MAG: hypothetical protein C0514_05550 [Candidatus Puniceispirillum sp.]|nr:hypothetical protein [Candidatus Puniceispirillum sp.]